MRVLIASLTLLLARLRLPADVRARRAAATAIGPVQVAEIEGKAGHVLRTELDRILAVENGGGDAVAAGDHAARNR